MNLFINIVWRAGRVDGHVEVAYGRLCGSPVPSPAGGAAGGAFDVSGDDPRVRIALAEANLESGAFATVVTVHAGERSFSFFARDTLHPACPVFIPAYGVAVTAGDDARSYAEIAAEIAGRRMVSELARFEAEPEESYDSAAAKNRRLASPTWLGVARDMRLFRVSPAGAWYCDGDSGFGYWGTIVAADHSVRRAEYGFAVGRGSACRYRIERRLEDGVLPIVRSVQREEGMAYHLTLFAALEDSPLAPGRVAGTDFKVCYANAGGNMLAPEERQRIQAGPAPESEVVLCCRVEAVNSGSTPCYAWFKAPSESGKVSALRDGLKLTVGQEAVQAAVRLDGRPAPQDELAVLVQPGAKAVFEFLLPHRPVSQERAARLLAWDFDAVHAAVGGWWRSKLAGAAQVDIPERPIHEHVRAGLLHCDLVAVGAEPDQPVAATIGWYAPIGTESSPIIQFFDSMGWHKLAERCLDFFIARQRDDGFIQNFGGYQSETGPWLWSMGEHFRYTRDLAWLRRVTPAMRKACEYLLAWRERNQTEVCRAGGYAGLVDGKVADPEDYFHQFYLNGGTYHGLSRCAEVLRHTDADFAARLSREVPAYREDIRRAFYAALGNAPVVPLDDGTWAPYPPPWAEGRGAPHFYAEGGEAFTHGAFASRSVLIGAMWLPFCEVLDPAERGSDFLVQTNQSPTTCDNAALSQPYYSRHDHLHLLRGEVKAFLRTYYNQATGLSDRETYTFWEHFWGASQHKTHEEGWFLMQTRWMLYMEWGTELRLFPGVPRAWLAAGEHVAVKGAASYFGPLDFSAATDEDGRRIRARVACASDRRPSSVSIRLPHPQGRRGVRLEGPGVYDAETETVNIDGFTGEAEVELGFDETSAGLPGG